MSRLFIPVLKTKGQELLTEVDPILLQDNSTASNLCLRSEVFEEQDSENTVVILIPDDIFDAVTDEELSVSIKNTFGCNSGQKFEIQHDVTADSYVLEQLAVIDQATKIMLLQEAWQPPIRETLSFIRRIREVTKPKAKIIIALIGRPEPNTVFTPVHIEDYKIWEQKINQIADPYLLLISIKEIKK